MTEFLRLAELILKMVDLIEQNEQDEMNQIYLKQLRGYANTIKQNSKGGK